MIVGYAGGMPVEHPVFVQHPREETIMAVKIFIKRQIDKSSLGEVSALLISARKNAMNHQGYISTETLVNYDDPCQVLVVSMWQKREDWDRYARSPERQENENNFASILAADTEYEIFKMGM
jgi:heme-degrading monooxygenase HmoA